MTIYQIAKRSVDTGTAQKIRHREGNQYDCQVSMWTGNNRGWTLLDHYTASAVVQIYENLKPENQEKYINMPLLKLLDITWQLVSRKN